MTTERFAKNLQKSLGTRVAAGYLRNRGVPLSLALRVLTGGYSYNRVT